MPYDKSSHAKYLLQAHLVICTKYREKVIYSSIKTEILNILEILNRRYQWNI
jgi:REP element-mobilizing transposase RayT